jgi:cyclophilin family peptidyl-prolyl cis-trans isomerase
MICSLCFISLSTMTAEAASSKDIIMETTLGNIQIKLNDSKAPVSTANFRRYVKEGFFNGLIFHRVIPGFMIQGGGFEPGMDERRGHAPIINEADNGLKNKRGTLSMARTSDINSASSQFFINVADNAFLDHTGKNPQGYGYAVFAEVVAGMDVVDKIVASPTTSVGYYQNVPKKDVIILKAYEKE